MREGLIEETHIPRNPLDVLAQQIVAICADDEISVDDLHQLVRGAYPFADLARAQLENVLDMLAGRYPSDEFAELRPRIVWDRTAGVVKGRQGARRLAVTNAGTIPDRGLFGVFQVEGGGRVGELDEEMVYEARQGQTFMLGASTWRIEEITRDRVLVSPAPGAPGAVPFWKGEGVGRPFELGEKIGRASREIVALSDAKALASLGSDYHLDPLAARNLLTYLRDQAAANGGVVPSDRTIVIERFRDEIGDWRLCILTPFGARVHAPWAMALGARLRDSLGLEVQSIWSDDGIAFHLPEADLPPPIADLLLTPEEIEDLVVQEVGQTALFGARFRENAGRALLIPRRRPGQRTPLWQQRLKAQSLLQVARNYGSFPIVLETYRECLQDVFDLPALKGILRGLQTRELDLVEVETASASPFASSLLFAYVATYMYEDDTPAAERRAQALSLDRDLLRELLGQEELRDLLDPAALADVEAQLAGDPRSPDEVHDLLRRRGDLRDDELDAAHAAVLEAERRALRVRIAGEERLIAIEDAGLFRDALGVMPPGGLPEAFLDTVPDALGVLLGRFARARGPFTTAEAADRYGLETRASPRAVSRRSSGPSGSFAASSAPAAPSASGVIPTCSGGCAVPRSPRCGRRWSRRSKRPSDASFLPGTGSTAGRRFGRRSSRCRGFLSPSRSGRARCCAAASPTITLRCSTLSVRRARSSGSERGSTGSPSTSAPMPRCSEHPPAHRRPRVTRRRRCVRRSSAPPSSGPISSRRPGSTRRWPFPPCGSSCGQERSRTMRGRRCERLADTELRLPTVGRADSHVPALPGRPRRRGAGRSPRDCFRPPSIAARSRSSCSRGRASSFATASAPRAMPGATAPSTESSGLSRRSAAAGEGTSSRASAGRSSRLPEPWSGLRELRFGAEGEALVLAAADPAQPYGAALPWPRRAGARAARVAGAHVVLLGGSASLFVERGGRTLVPLREPEEDVAAAGSRCARGLGAWRAREAPRSRAVRRQAGCRDRGDGPARRGRLPGRPSPCRAQAVTVVRSRRARRGRRRRGDGGRSPAQTPARTVPSVGAPGRLGPDGSDR